MKQSLWYINKGYSDIVDIELSNFFDEVAHYKILQLIYDKVKCETTLRLIRKWLRAPILINGKLRKQRRGLSQGSPLGPLLSNIDFVLQTDSFVNVLEKNVLVIIVYFTISRPSALDQCLENMGCNFIRYADDFSIYTRSKSEARSIGNEVYLFLRDKLDLQINRSKSGIRRPSNFKELGQCFTSIYKKGSKGQYQLIVSKSSWLGFKRKLKRSTKKTLGYCFVDRVKAIKLIYQGWINNYRLASIYTKLKKVDEWLRDRLRYCI